MRKRASISARQRFCVAKPRAAPGGSDLTGRSQRARNARSLRGDVSRKIGQLHGVIEETSASVDCRCLYYGVDGKRCKNQAIKSHSLQRKGPLQAISEHGHVIKIGHSLKAKPFESRELFELTGVKKASTFPGFCSEHDTSLFSEIEGRKVDLCEQTALLLFIRSIAIEHYKKKLTTSLYRNMFEQLGDEIRNDRKDYLRYAIRGSSIAVKHGEERLRLYFSLLHKRIPSNFHFVAARFAETLPFSCTGATEPDSDMNGNSLFLKDPLKIKWNTISTFCGCIGGSYYFFIGGLQRYRDHRALKFLRSVDLCSRDTAAMIFTLCATHFENLYARPSWVETLKQSEIDLLKYMIMSGVAEETRSKEALSSRL